MSNLSGHSARHPEVQASQIKEIHWNATDARIFLESGDSVMVDAGWLTKNMPKAGDFYILNADGTASSMKAAEFCAAYTQQ